jgi:metal-dependent amidase/aminoacylase/carboxypeptidase family protein
LSFNAPKCGRSALDGVEAMNHMVNLMREHVPDSTHIHYIITRDGEAPNIVPAFAESSYSIDRMGKRSELRSENRYGVSVQRVR